MKHGLASSRQAISQHPAVLAATGIGWYTLASQAGDRPRQARRYAVTAVVSGLVAGGIAGSAVKLETGVRPVTTYTEIAGNRSGSPVGLEYSVMRPQLALCGQRGVDRGDDGRVIVRWAFRPGLRTR